MFIKVIKKFFFGLFFTFCYIFFLLILPLLPLFFVNSLEWFLFLILKIIDFFYWIFFFLCIKINSWWINLIELYVVNIRYQPGETIKKGDFKVWSLIYTHFTYPFPDIVLIWSFWLYFLFEDDFFEETLEEKPVYDTIEEEELALETPPEDVVEIDGEEDFALEEEDDVLELYEDQDDPIVTGVAAQYALYPTETDDTTVEVSNDFPVQSSEFLEEEKKELLENDVEYEIFDDEFAFPYPAASLVEKCFWDFDLPEEFILLRFGWEPDLFDQEFFIYFRQTVVFFFIRFLFNFLPLAVVEFFFVQGNLTKAILKIPFFYNFLYFWFLLIEFLKSVFSKNIFIFLLIIIVLLFLLFLFFLC